MNGSRTRFLSVSFRRATRSLLLPPPRAPSRARVSLSPYPPPLFFLPARRVPGMSAARSAKCSQHALGGGGGERGVGGGRRGGPSPPSEHAARTLKAPARRAASLFGAVDVWLRPPATRLPASSVLFPHPLPSSPIRIPTDQWERGADALLKVWKALY